MKFTTLALAAVSPLALTSTLSAPAQAGGFFLQEQSPLDVGRAFAGSAAIGDSAATVWYNPAGMTNLPGLNIELGSHLLDVTSHQRDTGSTRSGPGGVGSFPSGGNSGGNPFSNPVFIPSGFATYQVGDTRLWIGLGITAPFGLKVVYNDGFFGRYDSLKSDLKAFNIQPSAAYKITDNISIGGGVDIQTFKATLTSALPNLSPLLPDGSLRIKGDDVSVGWNAGVQGNFGPLRLGAHYRSHINQRLDGKVTIAGLLGPLAGSNGVRDGVAPISTPDIATVSAVYGIGNARLLGSVNWYNWSRFKRITVEDNTGAVFLDSEQNYRDTWSYSLGGEYDLSKKLTVRAGAMHDQTPTRDELRTTRVPDGNRIWATTGATYRMNDHVALNFSYAHVFVKAANVDRIDPVFAGTPAVVNVNTMSRNTGNADEIAGSVSLRF
ncbi:OmpP1/FadL family transporter [Sphingosinicellaceae bacterium]|nr:OmpP1/FadL family transporter [Sphingosinicellaceae bacterium]